MPGVKRPHEDDDVQFLVTSDIRIRLLAALQEGTVRVQDLASELDISRASLSRNIRYLKEKGWVVDREGGVSISTTGRLALESYREFAESIGTVKEMQEFLRWLPPSEATEIELEHLDGSSVVTPEPLNPMLPVNEFTALLRETGEARGMAKTYLPAMKDSLRSRVQDGMALETVLSRGMGEMLKNGDLDICREVAGSDGVRLYLHGGEFPFDLWVLDGTLVMMSYDGDGLPRALLRNTRSDAVKWGRSLFETYRSESEEFEMKE